MKRMRLIMQHDEKDCGAACMTMLLQYYGRRNKLASIRESLQTDQYGSNVYSMLNTAEQEGLLAEVQAGRSDEAWEAIVSGEIPLPAVIRFVSHETYEHYAIVERLKHSGSELLLYDPADGRRSMSKAEFERVFLGEVMTFQPGPDFRKENLRKGSLRRFSSMVFRQKKLLFVIALLSLAVTGIGIAGTMSFQFLIDHVLTGIGSMEEALEKLELFAMLITSLVMLYLLKVGFQLLRTKLLAAMSKRIDLPLMLGFFDKVTTLPARAFDTRKTAEITSRFSDAEKIRDAISGVTLTLMLDTVLIVISGGVIYHMSHALFAIALVSFVIYLALSALFVKPFEKTSRAAMESSEQFNSYLKEAVDGMQTVKSVQAEETIREKTGALFLAFLKKGYHTGVLSATKDTFVDFATSIAKLVLLWVGANEILQGSMTVGALVTASSLLDFFLSPVQNIVQLQSGIQTALVAADRMNDILDLNSERAEGEVPSEAIHSLQMEGVSFRYGARELVLQGVHFKVESGQTIGIAGPSGSGKSTISKLLMGFYEPESGEVLINGISTREISLSWLRSQTAVVPQATFLFSDTIRNNLLLGFQKEHVPTDEEILRLLDQCGCQFVRDMPLGLDSLLEENGQNLSGGQKQRLSIVRALLREPKLLILDEATSALDAISEQQVLQTLSSIRPDMITIMITHRLNTLSALDCKILVLEKGAVAEFGSHEELMRCDGLYQDMWRSQIIAA